MKNLRHKIYHQLDVAAWHKPGLSKLNFWLVILIFFSVAMVVAETEAGLYRRYGLLFDALNIFFMVVFTVEYFTRVWSKGENPEYTGIKGRLKYIFSPVALIDLLAILPFYFSLFGSDWLLLRIVRLFRIFVLARLGRYTLALKCLIEAITARSHELFLVLILASLVLLFSATGIYLAERDIQPENFGSIPRALYWSVITMTTVGYGDVVPLTVIGKMMAVLTAVASVALIAMPAGIMAAAFSEAMQRQKSR